ncbi:MAG: hypothetical protein QOC66_589, partial [Pseudonocardiales bacterium]|nr:hypothetical protein [Pseudonocardiales bacterium]
MRVDEDLADAHRREGSPVGGAEVPSAIFGISGVDHSSENDSPRAGNFDCIPCGRICGNDQPERKVPLRGPRSELCRVRSEIVRDVSCSCLATPRQSASRDVPAASKVRLKSLDHRGHCLQNLETRGFRHPADHVRGRNRGLPQFAGWLAVVAAVRSRPTSKDECLRTGFVIELGRALGRDPNLDSGRL